MQEFPALGLNHQTVILLQVSGQGLAWENPALKPGPAFNKSCNIDDENQMWEAWGIIYCQQILLKLDILLITQDFLFVCASNEVSI